MSPWESWVTANTKIRSKNSSTKATLRVLVLSPRAQQTGDACPAVVMR